MGQGPAKFPRDEATPDEPPQSRVEEKIREVEEGRRAGTISDEDFEEERTRLLAEGPGE